MIARVWFILKYWFTWILFFEGARLLFLLANYKEAKIAGTATAFKSLWYGLRMDASMAAYFTIPVSLMVLLSVFVSFLRKGLVYKIYSAIILLLCLILVVADIGLFQAWGFRLDGTVIKYLSNPKEVWASISHLPVFTILTGFIICYVFLLFLSHKWLRKNITLLQQTSNKPVGAIIILFFTALFIIPIRGGLQLAPLNQSSVYFSQNNFANQAAINAVWNFMYALNHQANNKENPFNIAETTIVKAVADSLLTQTSNTAFILDTTRLVKPNVLIIVWESLTSKALGLTAEGKSITPGMNALIKEGIYFSDIYATGDRTDKGIVGVLSGYPAQATTSIVKQPAKAAKLPMLSKMFKQQGYHTSFFYGGELEFANMKAYLLQGGFNDFISISDFAKKDQNSKWGAHDGVVMNRVKDDIGKSPQPFFATWLTLSSHEPYEIPTKPLLAGKDDVAKFLSSIHYTDSIVAAFIQFAKQQAWWKNTLVVIVADHGHRLPRASEKPADFKIPLLFLGGAINAVPVEISTTGSQTDIATTILTQLRYNSREFKWSRNMLDSSYQPWAFFTFNNGFGYIQPTKKLVFDNVGKRPIYSQGNITEADIFNGRALQQRAFEDYLLK